MILLVSCRNDSRLNEAIRDDQNTLVEVSYLVDQQENTEVKIIDFRTPEAYLQGHIPGAINIWRNDLENLSYPYGGMMPSKKQVEELFSSLGIKNDDILIVYDDKGSVDATRLWWILSYYEFEPLKILNGGLRAWKQSGGKIDKGIPVHSLSEFTLPSSERIDIKTNMYQIEKWVNNEERPIKIIDARSVEEYTGELQKKGAKRSGRIPGSVRIEWIETIDTLNANKFRDRQDLIKLYDSKGIYSTDSIIVYCHSGSRSSHTTFVLREILNYKSVMNYDGSWTEWSYYPHLPIEQDSLNLTMN